MRTTVLAIGIALWLAAALYVAMVVLVAALRRGRHHWTSPPALRSSPSRR